MVSRRQREGHFMGKAWGKVVRRYAPPVPHPRSAFARAYQAGRIVRRSGVPFEVTHLADQQGAQ